MNRERVKEITERMEEVLNELAEELGGTFIFKGGDFTETELTSKIVFINGTLEAARKKEFRALAHMYDLKPTDFGRTFKFYEDDFKIVGLDTKARKYNIIVTKFNDNTKAEYKMSAAAVKARLENSK